MVIFGVTDNGSIRGQEVSDKTRRGIADALRNFEPFAQIKTEYIEIPNNKFVIILSCNDYISDKPFTYKGRAYQRIESSTSIMPQQIYNNLLFQREQPKHRWEVQLNPDLTLEDLNEDEIRRTIRMGVESGRLPETTFSHTIKEALERMHLMRRGLLTNAAAVLFAKDIGKVFPQCTLRLARFKGLDKTVFIDNKQIHANAFVMLDEALAFCFKHLSLHGEIKNLLREEQLTIPYAALRESIVNALCHRDYQTIGGSISIAIFDDRVEISNYGRFPKQLDIPRLRTASQSLPINPLIASAFYYRQLFENWGRGIDLIVDECKKHDMPMPIFQSSNYMVSVIFPLQEQKDLQRDLQNLTDNQKKILEIIRETPYVTQKELSEQIGINTKNIRNNIAKLKAAGRLTRIGPDKGGYWQVNE